MTRTINFEKNIFFKKERNSRCFYSVKNSFLIFIACCFPLAISFFGSNIGFDIFIALFFLVILFFTKVKGAVLFYAYLVYFSHLTRSSGTTVVSFIGLFLSFVIIVKYFKAYYKYALFLIFLLIYSLLPIVLSSDFSGLSLIYSFVIAAFVRERIKANDKMYIKEFFFSFFLAALISTLYGFFHFLGPTTRFSLPIGIDSACMLLIGGMIYPLFYVKRIVKKVVMIAVLTIPLLLTVSITALICLLIFYFFVVFHYLFVEKRANLQKKTIILFLTLCFVFFVIIIWNYDSRIYFVSNIVYRLKTVTNQVAAGELNTATTGRYDIYKIYFGYFNSFDFINKLFGGGRLNYYGLAYYRNYSHNTFLDALMFFGIIPLMLLVYLLLYGLFSVRNKTDSFKLFLLKLTFLTTGMSVSLLSGGYWLLVIFI